MMLNDKGWWKQPWSRPYLIGLVVCTCGAAVSLAVLVWAVAFGSSWRDECRERGGIPIKGRNATTVCLDPNAVLPAKQ